MTDFSEFFAHLKSTHNAASREIDVMENILVNLRFEGRSHQRRNILAVQKMILHFRANLFPHIEEDERIFDFLEQHIPRLAVVIGLLRSDHREFKKKLRHLQNLTLRTGLLRPEDVERIKLSGLALAVFMRNHLNLEQDGIYNVLRKELRASEKESLRASLVNLPCHVPHRS